MVIKSPGLAGIYEKPANLGFFLFLRVLVANQRGEVYLLNWIFDYNNDTSIQSYHNKIECIYDFHKDFTIGWLINHEKNSNLLG